MKFECTEVFNFEGAIRGMRNPMNSWNKSDSDWDFTRSNGPEIDTWFYKIGENDLQLMQKLIKAGSEHRKFMRQILVSVDITAPLYWWKEFDTYKVGTVANSTSTMHKLASKEITIDDFEMGDFSEVLDNDIDGYIEMDNVWEFVVFTLERLRLSYNRTKDKKYWKELIRLLPESYLQKRTVTMNYENIFSIIRHRKNHKLTEWSVDFINWTKSLPYAEELLYLGINDGK